MQVFLRINTEVTWSKLNDKQRGVCGVFRSEAYIYGLNAIGLVFIGIWSEAGSRVSIHVTRCTVYPNKYQKTVSFNSSPGETEYPGIRSRLRIYPDWRDIPL